MSWPAATLLAVGSKYVPTSATEKPVDTLTLTDAHTQTNKQTNTLKSHSVKNVSYFTKKL